MLSKIVGCKECKQILYFHSRNLFRRETKIILMALSPLKVRLFSPSLLYLRILPARGTHGSGEICPAMTWLSFGFLFTNRILSEDHYDETTSQSAFYANLYRAVIGPSG